MVKQWLKLSHHRHSGRLRPHEHTSYGPLVLLLLLVAYPLCTYTAYAAGPHPDPQSGSIGLNGTMPGKPPTTAATIKVPGNGQHFSTSPITVSGSCPANTLVEIYKSDIFAGSTACSANGTFSLEVDLLIGQNELVAKVYDDLNQPGPDSNKVTVFYDALPPQSGALVPLNFGGTQLVLNTDAIFRGGWPDKELTVPLDVIGGTPPYAINFLWGDASNKVVPRGDNATFKTLHAYKKPGVYQISIQATDANGRVAFLSVAAIVNGQAEVASSSAAATPSASAINQLLVLWPVYVSAFVAVTSFWMGERREKRLLEKHGLLNTV